MDQEKVARIVKKVIKAYNEEKLKNKPQDKNQKEDQMLKQLEKEIGLATSKVGNLKEAGRLGNILSGLAMAVALLNSGAAKADAWDLHKYMQELNGASQGMVETVSKINSSGEGKYTLKAGPYTFEGDFSSVSLMPAKHTVKKTVDNGASKEELEKYKGVAEKMEKMLDNEANDKFFGGF